MAKIKVSDYFVKRLPELTGSQHVFLLSGGGMMHLLDSLGRSSLSLVPMHHEQAAAIAADACGRVQNNVGICFVTTGPGGTNAVTGVAGAWMESTPVLYVSGQVSRANSALGLPIRQKGIQEVDMIPIVQSVTKYAVRVLEPTEIRYHLEKATFLARSGRPGPVWLDIPLDVSAATVDEDSLSGFDAGDLADVHNPAPSSAEIERVLELLARAKRPLVLLGHGVRLSGAAREALQLVEQLGVPVQTSWNGMDLIEEDHPLFFGRANLFGPRYPNLIIQNCDLLLCLGSRLGMQHTGYNIKAFAREATKIMVDLDEGEMTKPNLDISLRIRADVSKFVRLLNQKKPSPIPCCDWLDYCRRIKTKYPTAPSLDRLTGANYVDPYYFAATLADRLPEGTTVPFASSGMSHTITGGVFRVKKGQRVFTSKGLAAMGYALPSSIGACFGSGRKTTVTVIGDGGFQLNIQELQTIRHHQLPVKIFVFNNRGYHSIRMTQNAFFQSRYVASSAESGVSLPELSAIAQAYGIPYSQIRTNEKLANEIDGVLATPGPTLCEVLIDPDKPLEPKISSYVKPDGTMESRPLEDMTPLIERDEFYRDMLIKPIT